jgi:hypothetical protein
MRDAINLRINKLRERALRAHRLTRKAHPLLMKLHANIEHIGEWPQYDVKDLLDVSQDLYLLVLELGEDRCDVMIQDATTALDFYADGKHIDVAKYGDDAEHFTHYMKQDIEDGTVADEALDRIAQEAL